MTAKFVQVIDEFSLLINLLKFNFTFYYIFKDTPPPKKNEKDKQEDT